MKFVMFFVENLVKKVTGNETKGELGIELQCLAQQIKAVFMNCSLQDEATKTGGAWDQLLTKLVWLREGASVWAALLTARCKVRCLWKRSVKPF